MTTPKPPRGYVMMKDGEIKPKGYKYFGTFGWSYGHGTGDIYHKNMDFLNCRPITRTKQSKPKKSYGEIAFRAFWKDKNVKYGVGCSVKHWDLCARAVIAEYKRREG